MNTQILIVDFGSQYTLLIAKMIRGFNIYCEVILPEKLPSYSPDSSLKGLILSGGPESVSENKDTISQSNLAFKSYLDSDCPILGICYGAQLLAKHYGAQVIPESTREYGQTNLHIVYPADPIHRKIARLYTVWNSHSDSIQLPEGSSKDESNLILLAQTAQKVPACFRVREKSQYGFQFHPEVTHTPLGPQLFSNFLDLTHAQADWTPDCVITQTIQELQARIPEDERVLVACSGGVDSTVTATLLQRALGDRFVGVFVDTGLLRANEAEQVSQAYDQAGLHVTTLRASERFFLVLKNISDPETKRRLIGHLFIDLFTEFANEQNRTQPERPIRWLGQGTIYPDVIESHGKIKSHHNVGGLPEKLGLQLVEPLRRFFKNEVRKVGRLLGLNSVLLDRYPFPGPGLAIRILGAVNPTKVQVLQLADQIWLQMLAEEGYQAIVWQAGAVLLNCQSVGVMGDRRTYEAVVALRAVQSENGMTASIPELPTEFLTRVSTRIVNEVPGVNRVVYDITTKPPGTIEWE